MLLCILYYIVEIIYFDVYLCQKILDKELQKEKLLNDDNVEIIDITVDDKLDKAVDDLIKKIKEMKEDE